jgi:putative ABC transport system substrate-binding protein
MNLRRREFIARLGGAAAAWPLAARAQQAEPLRRVGALKVQPKDHPATQSNIAAFRERLAMLATCGSIFASPIPTVSLRMQRNW